MKYKWKCEFLTKSGCRGTKFHTTRKRAESYGSRLLAQNGHPALPEEDAVISIQVSIVDEYDIKYLDMLNMGGVI